MGDVRVGDPTGLVPVVKEGDVRVGDPTGLVPVVKEGDVRVGDPTGLVPVVKEVEWGRVQPHLNVGLHRRKAGGREVPWFFG